VSPIGPHVNPRDLMQNRKREKAQKEEEPAERDQGIQGDKGGENKKRGQKTAISLEKHRKKKRGRRRKKKKGEKMQQRVEARKTGGGRKQEETHQYENSYLQSHKSEGEEREKEKEKKEKRTKYRTGSRGTGRKKKKKIGKRGERNKPSSYKERGIRITKKRQTSDHSEAKRILCVDCKNRLGPNSITRAQ